MKPFAGKLVFTGQSYGLDESSKFITEYEQNAKIMRWDDATKALRFPIYLQEPAKSWHRHASLEDINLWENWEQLKKKFKERFIPKGTQQTATELVQNHKQKPMESVLS